MAELAAEFQGILILNEQLVHQLEQHLERREAKACVAILKSVEIETAPILPTPRGSDLKFTETVELLGKQLRHWAQAPFDPSKFALIVKGVNTILLDYFEVLESSAIELFQQLDQMGIEDWSLSLRHCVDEIKEIIIRHLDDLNWAALRLDYQLSHYRFQKSFLKFFLFWQRSIDRSLRKNLEKCRKFLGFNYKKFSDQYERYIEMHTSIELAVEKFSDYLAISRL